MKKILLLILILAVTTTAFSQGSWTLTGSKNRWGNGMSFSSKTDLQLAAFSGSSDSILLQFSRDHNTFAFRNAVSDPWQYISVLGSLDTSNYWIPVSTNTITMKGLVKNLSLTGNIQTGGLTVIGNATINTILTTAISTSGGLTTQYYAPNGSIQNILTATAGSNIFTRSGAGIITSSNPNDRLDFSSSTQQLPLNITTSASAGKGATITTSGNLSYALFATSSGTNSTTANFNNSSGGGDAIQATNGVSGGRIWSGVNAAGSTRTSSITEAGNLSIVGSLSLPGTSSQYVKGDGTYGFTSGIGGVYVTDIAGLRNFTGTVSTIIVTDSARGGTFIYQTTGAVPDSGIVFNAVGKGSGYWVRKFNQGTINVNWFGAVSDNSTDNLIALRAVFSSVYASGATIQFPGASGQAYRISDSLLISSPCLIEGNGTGYSQLFLTVANKNLFVVNSSSVIFQNIALQNIAGTTTGIGIRFVTAQFCRLENVMVSEFGTLVKTETGSNFIVHKSSFYDPYTYSFLISNVVNPDQGDFDISGGNTFITGAHAGATVIRQLSGGGLRVMNNKFNTNGPSRSAYIADLNFTGSTSQFMFQNNNCESFDSSAVRVSHGAGITFTSIKVDNNYFTSHVSAYGQNIVDVASTGINLVSVTNNTAFILNTGRATWRVSNSDNVVLYANNGTDSLINCTTVFRPVTSIAVTNGITNSNPTPNTSGASALGLADITPSSVNTSGNLTVTGAAAISATVGIGTLTPTFTSGRGLQVRNWGGVGVMRVSGGASTGFDIQQDPGGIGYLFNRDNAGIVFGANNATVGSFSSAGVLTITNLGTGAVQATAGVLSVVSSSQFKNDLGYFKGSASKAIMKLDGGHYYTWNKKSGLPQNVKMFGLFADKVYNILGEEFAPTQKDGLHSLSDRALLSLTIQALQEETKKVESLEARIAALEKLIKK